MFKWPELSRERIIFKLSVPFFVYTLLYRMIELLEVKETP